MKNLFLLIVIWLGAVSMGSGQAFVQLSNATGYEYSISEVEVLNAVSQSLYDIFPDTLDFKEFAVIDFGLFSQNRLMTEGIDGFWAKSVEKARDVKKYHLLFARCLIDDNGTFQLRAHLNINPNLSNCINLDEINNHLNYSGYFEGPLNGAYEAQVQYITIVKELLHQYVECCDNNRSDVCNDATYIDDSEAFIAQTSKHWNGNYITPTGCIFKLEGNVSAPIFYSTNDNNNPTGALLRFHLDGIPYSAYTDESKLKFFGYKASPYSEPLKNAMTFSNGDTEVVYVGHGYKDCISNIYKFDYTQSHCPINSITGESESENGGIGYDKEGDIRLDFTPKLLVHQNSINGNTDVHFTEIEHWIGDYLNWETIYYADELNIPCPIEVSPNDLLHGNLPEAKYFTLKNGSVTITSGSGLFNIFNVNNEWFVNAYVPGLGSKNSWVPYTLKDWEGPGDLYVAFVRDIVNVASNPHAGLTVISLTNIPIIAQAADLIDASIYFIEGESGEGVLSLIGVIPGITEIRSSGKWTVNIIEIANKVKKFNKSSKSFEGMPLQKIEELKAYVAQNNLTKAEAIALSKYFNEYGHLDDFYNNKKLVDTYLLLLRSNDARLNKFANDFETIKALEKDIAENSNFAALVNSGENLDETLHTWKLCSESSPKIQLCTP